MLSGDYHHNYFAILQHIVVNYSNHVVAAPDTQVCIYVTVLQKDHYVKLYQMLC